MGKRKYRFESRAEAEEAYRRVDRERLQAEWFASAIIQGKLHHVGSVKDGYHTVHVAHFSTAHSYFVAAYTDERRSCHCLKGVWDVDELSDIVAALIRYEDSYEFGRLLDKARFEAVRRTECISA